MAEATLEARALKVGAASLASRLFETGVVLGWSLAAERLGIEAVWPTFTESAEAAGPGPDVEGIGLQVKGAAATEDLSPSTFEESVDVLGS